MFLINPTVALIVIQDAVSGFTKRIRVGISVWHFFWASLEWFSITWLNHANTSCHMIHFVIMTSSWRHRHGYRWKCQKFSSIFLLVLLQKCLKLTRVKKCQKLGCKCQKSPMMSFFDILNLFWYHFRTFKEFAVTFSDIFVHCWNLEIIFWHF